MMISPHLSLFNTINRVIAFKKIIAFKKYQTLHIPLSVIQEINF